MLVRDELLSCFSHHSFYCLQYMLSSRLNGWVQFTRDHYYSRFPLGLPFSFGLLESCCNGFSVFEVLNLEVFTLPSEVMFLLSTNMHEGSFGAIFLNLVSFEFVARLKGCVIYVGVGR